MILGGEAELRGRGMFRSETSERGGKGGAVLVVAVDRLAPVPAVHDMINRAGILDAKGPGHRSGGLAERG